MKIVVPSIRKIFYYNFFIILNCFLLVSCSSTRKPLTPGEIPTPKPTSLTDEQYGHEVLTKLSEEYKLDSAHPELIRIEKLVDKITKTVNSTGAPWHISIFDEPKVVNAAATRGNHIFLWTGILDLAENDDELALILAHEVAHVVAGHTEEDPNEETKKILISVGSAILGTTVSVISGVNVTDLTAAVAQHVSEGFLVNPYSRELEHEADQLGLLLAHRAGFDILKSIKLWERNANNPKLSSTFEFFSTHPLAEDRYIKLKELAEKIVSGNLTIVELNNSQNNNSQNSNTQGSISQNNTTQNNNSQINNNQKGTPPLLNNQGKNNQGQNTPAQNTPVQNKGELNPGTQNTGMQNTGKQNIGGSNTAGSNSEPPKLTQNGYGTTSNSSTKTELWRVKSEIAYLYLQPNSNSKKIGEFKKGAELRTFPHHSLAVWIEITNPDHGFININDLEKIK